MEASLLGVRSVGVDFDALAAFITLAKVTPLTQQQIKRLKSYWARVNLTKHKANIPAVPNITHWFTNEAVNQLGAIKSAALDIDDVDLSRFSLAVMSSIVRRSSNADDQTQKTYVSGTLKKFPPKPFEIFPSVMQKAILGIEHYSLACQVEPKVLRGDARTLSFRRRFDAAITSPPYIDSIDYVYNQMLEYYWLHDVLGIEIAQIPGLRKLPMGFVSEDFGVTYASLKKLSPKAAKILSPHVTAIAKSSPKEARHVSGFFWDMALHAKVMHKLLKPGARYAMVVGESFIRGQQVPTPDVIPHIFGGCGFRNAGNCSYVIKRHYMKFPRRSNSGKIVMDYVLCFERQ
jgi:hypothetical protein